MSDGIPPLQDPPPTDPVVPMTADDPNIATAAQWSTGWGIYIEGSPALDPTPDSIVALEFRNDSKITNAPQEEGAFQSYNKVASPYTVRVTMTKGGSSAERAQFLSAVDTICGSIFLYDVVTPDKTYLRLNPTHQDYHRRANNGVSLLTVDVWFEEVRAAGDVQYTTGAALAVSVANAKDPAAKDPKPGGVKPPKDATPTFTGSTLSQIKTSNPLGPRHPR